MVLLTPEEFSCVVGCNDAVTTYISQLREYLKDSPAPALLADSLTATSLQLEWNYTKANIVGLEYLVQCKYEEHSDAWQFCNCTKIRDIIFAVSSLQPFTKYRARTSLRGVRVVSCFQFRIAIVLFFQEFESVVSAQSVVIMTYAAPGRRLQEYERYPWTLLASSSAGNPVPFATVLSYTT